MNEASKKRKAMLLMVITACMWSLGGLFIKLISWSPFMIAGVRSIIAGGIMAAYMKKESVAFKLNRYSLFAGIGLGLSATLFTVANKLTTAANAIVLQYTAPIFILILSAILFREKMKKKEVGVVLVTMAGMVLFFLDQLSPGNVVGNILGILAGVFLGLMFVMVGKGGDDDSTRMSGILIAHTITLLIGLPLGMAGVMSGSAVAAGGAAASGAVATGASLGLEILYVVILGVFQLGIPYVLYGIASRDCSPLACSLIGMLEPLLNPVWVAIFTGEVPGMFAMAGAVVIIATVTWWCVQESRDEAALDP